MYFLRYEVLPNPNAARLRDFGNTIALCWIRQAIQANADLQARISIEQAGWEIRYLEEAYPVKREDYQPDHPAQHSCDIAEQKGEHIVFITVPKKG